MDYGLDPDKLREECGVVGIFNDNPTDTARLLYHGLYALQHRGQESAGIAINDGAKCYHHKGMGLVFEIFDEDILRNLKGRIGIGHVRYSTSGESYIGNAQPLVVRYRGGTIAMAHNGNLINASLIRNRLEEDGLVFQTTIDSEVIVYLIARYSSEGMLSAIERTMDHIKGAYALALMTEDSLIGVRDPLGLRPLALGKADDVYLLASESCAFDVMGASLIREVEPGEILQITKEGIRSTIYRQGERRASCIFEYIYFARPDSIMDNVSVYRARKNAGIILAKEHPVEADVVIAVPDTSIPSAIGYAEESKIPYGEGLIKNRYIGRTFIQPTQSLRETAVRLKLNPVRENVEGKRVVMIDDSIVRGTTSRRLVRVLKEAGAKEVHVRVSSPPVTCSCFFGIDTPDKSQLISGVQSIEQIRRIIEADSLGHISIEGVVASTGMSSHQLCLACFNGDYPLAVEDPKKGNGREGEDLYGAYDV